jgi:hypothetical protein
MSSQVADLTPHPCRHVSLGWPDSGRTGPVGGDVQAVGVTIHAVRVEMAVQVQRRGEDDVFRVPVITRRSIPRSVVVSHERAQDWLAGAVVVPDRGGQGQDALEYPDDDPGRGVPAVPFEVELAFECLVDRLDDLA